jgi:DNA polymerase elongation subunit (family B)
MEIDLNKFKLDKNKEELNINEITYLDTLSQDQIKELINYCDKQYNYFNAMQNALKLILNSVYGAFGNEFFVCSTKEIAGAITAMGRDIIKYMDHINETY